ncbi:uncharacterized protein MONBRDRAFT_12175 [Monosiga brevicollis MX1]|uniref:Uncharacterized protein n=1 Tax=Monosiga brevicollis TaxID=81824 RepID=A9VBG0_MONBE|nr:uncharacterized protein MONBRDRAFT_12175 [Monosiga brevicollis MX1]EDQ85179.1 predicted protein [Monosiga brevicollis MX1]|eukprot:XP_001750004.1 hypothetical protein [Monosiga brevicollis MX1]
MQYVPSLINHLYTLPPSLTSGLSELLNRACKDTFVKAFFAKVNLSAPAGAEGHDVTLEQLLEARLFTRANTGGFGLHDLVERGPVAYVCNMAKLATRYPRVYDRLLEDASRAADFEVHVQRAGFQMATVKDAATQRPAEIIALRSKAALDDLMAKCALDLQQAYLASREWGVSTVLTMRGRDKLRRLSDTTFAIAVVSMMGFGLHELINIKPTDKYATLSHVWVEKSGYNANGQSCRIDLHCRNPFPGGALGPALPDLGIDVTVRTAQPPTTSQACIKVGAALRRAEKEKRDYYTGFNHGKTLIVPAAMTTTGGFASSFVDLLGQLARCAEARGVYQPGLDEAFVPRWKGRFAALVHQMNADHIQRHFGGVCLRSSSHRASDSPSSDRQASALIRKPEFSCVRWSSELRCFDMSRSDRASDSPSSDRQASALIHLPVFSCVRWSSDASAGALNFEAHVQRAGFQMATVKDAATQRPAEIIALRSKAALDDLMAKCALDLQQAYLASREWGVSTVLTMRGRDKLRRLSDTTFAIAVVSMMGFGLHELINIKPTDNLATKHIAGKLNDMLTTGVSLQALLTAMQYVPSLINHLYTLPPSLTSGLSELLNRACKDTFVKAFFAKVNLSAPAGAEGHNVTLEQLLEARLFTRANTGGFGLHDLVERGPVAYVCNMAKLATRYPRVYDRLLEDESRAADFEAHVQRAGFQMATWGVSTVLTMRGRDKLRRLSDTTFAIAVVSMMGFGLHELINIKPTDKCPLCSSKTPQPRLTREHLLTCRPIKRHNALRDEMGRLLRYATLSHVWVEKSGYNPNGQSCRIDLHCRNPFPGGALGPALPDLGIDVTVRTAQPPTTSQACIKVGAALRRAEKEKRDYYTGFNHGKTLIVPAAMTTTGGFASSFVDLLGQLARCAEARGVYQPGLDEAFVPRWKGRFAALVHQMNADHIQRHFGGVCLRSSSELRCFDMSRSDRASDSPSSDRRASALIRKPEFSCVRWSSELRCFDMSRSDRASDSPSSDRQASALIRKPEFSCVRWSSDASGGALNFDASTCRDLIGHRIARARIGSLCSDPPARALMRPMEL